MLFNWSRGSWSLESIFPFQVDGKDSEKNAEKEAEIKKESTESGEAKKSEEESKPETARDRVIKDGQLQVDPVASFPSFWHLEGMFTH